jgi:hypothetical protein
VATKKFVLAQASGPPVCVERRNNATLALARYFLPPGPSAPLPRVRPFGAGLFSAPPSRE